MYNVLSLKVIVYKLTKEGNTIKLNDFPIFF